MNKMRMKTHERESILGSKVKKIKILLRTHTMREVQQQSVSKFPYISCDKLNFIEILKLIEVNRKCKRHIFSANIPEKVDEEDFLVLKTIIFDYKSRINIIFIIQSLPVHLFLEIDSRNICSNTKMILGFDYLLEIFVVKPYLWRHSRGSDSRLYKVVFYLFVTSTVDLSLKPHFSCFNRRSYKALSHSIFRSAVDTFLELNFQDVSSHTKSVPGFSCLIVKLTMALFLNFNLSNISRNCEKIRFLDERGAISDKYTFRSKTMTGSTQRNPSIGSLSTMRFFSTRYHITNPNFESTRQNFSKLLKSKRIFKCTFFHIDPVFNGKGYQMLDKMALFMKTRIIYRELDDLNDIFHSQYNQKKGKYENTGMIYSKMCNMKEMIHSECDKFESNYECDHKILMMKICSQNIQKILSVSIFPARFNPLAYLTKPDFVYASDLAIFIANILSLIWKNDYQNTLDRTTTLENRILGFEIGENLTRFYFEDVLTHSNSLIVALSSKNAIKISKNSKSIEIRDHLLRPCGFKVSISDGIVPLYKFISFSIAFFRIPGKKKKCRNFKNNSSCCYKIPKKYSNWFRFISKDTKRKSTDINTHFRYAAFPKMCIYNFTNNQWIKINYKTQKGCSYWNDEGIRLGVWLEKENKEANVCIHQNSPRVSILWSSFLDTSIHFYMVKSKCWDFAKVFYPYLFKGWCLSELPYILKLIELNYSKVFYLCKLRLFHSKKIFSVKSGTPMKNYFLSSELICCELVSKYLRNEYALLEKVLVFLLIASMEISITKTKSKNFSSWNKDHTWPLEYKSLYGDGFKFEISTLLKQILLFLEPTQTSFYDPFQYLNFKLLLRLMKLGLYSRIISEIIENKTQVSEILMSTDDIGWNLKHFLSRKYRDHSMFLNLKSPKNIQIEINTQPNTCASKTVFHFCNWRSVINTQLNLLQSKMYYEKTFCFLLYSKSTLYTHLLKDFDRIFKIWQLIFSQDIASFNSKTIYPYFYVMLGLASNNDVIQCSMPTDDYFNLFVGQRNSFWISATSVPCKIYKILHLRLIKKPKPYWTNLGCDIYRFFIKNESFIVSRVSISYEGTLSTLGFNSMKHPGPNRAYIGCFVKKMMNKLFSLDKKAIFELVWCAQRIFSKSYGCLYSRNFNLEIFTNSDQLFVQEKYFHQKGISFLSGMANLFKTSQCPKNNESMKIFTLLKKYLDIRLGLCYNYIFLRVRIIRYIFILRLISLKYCLIIKFFRNSKRFNPNYKIQTDSCLINKIIIEFLTSCRKKIDKEMNRNEGSINEFYMTKSEFSKYHNIRWFLCLLSKFIKFRISLKFNARENRGPKFGIEKWINEFRIKNVATNFQTESVCKMHPEFIRHMALCDGISKDELTMVQNVRLGQGITIYFMIDLSNGRHFIELNFLESASFDLNTKRILCTRTDSKRNFCKQIILWDEIIRKFSEESEKVEILELIRMKTFIICENLSKKLDNFESCQIVTVVIFENKSEELDNSASSHIYNESATNLKDFFYKNLNIVSQECWKSYVYFQRRVKCRYMEIFRNPTKFEKILIFLKNNELYWNILYLFLITIYDLSYISPVKQAFNSPFRSEISKNGRMSIEQKFLHFNSYAIEYPAKNQRKKRSKTIEALRLFKQYFLFDLNAAQHHKKNYRRGHCEPIKNPQQFRRALFFIYNYFLDKTNRYLDQIIILKSVFKFESHRLLILMVFNFHSIKIACLKSLKDMFYVLYRSRKVNSYKKNYLTQIILDMEVLFLCSILHIYLGNLIREFSTLRAFVSNLYFVYVVLIRVICEVNTNIPSVLRTKSPLGRKTIYLPLFTGSNCLEIYTKEKTRQDFKKDYKNFVFCKCKILRQYDFFKRFNECKLFGGDGGFQGNSNSKAVENKAQKLENDDLLKNIDFKEINTVCKDTSIEDKGSSLEISLNISNSVDGQVEITFTDELETKSKEKLSPPSTLNTTNSIQSQGNIPAIPMSQVDSKNRMTLASVLDGKNTNGGQSKDNELVGSRISSGYGNCSLKNARHRPLTREKHFPSCFCKESVDILDHLTSQESFLNSSKSYNEKKKQKVDDSNSKNNMTASICIKSTETNLRLGSTDSLCQTTSFDSAEVQFNYYQNSKRTSIRSNTSNLPISETQNKLNNFISTAKPILYYPTQENNAKNYLGSLNTDSVQKLASNQRLFIENKKSPSKSLNLENNRRNFITKKNISENVPERNNSILNSLENPCDTENLTYNEPKADFSDMLYASCPLLDDSQKYTIKIIYKPTFTLQLRLFDSDLKALESLKNLPNIDLRKHIRKNECEIFNNSDKLSILNSDLPKDEIRTPHISQISESESLSAHFKNAGKQVVESTGSSLSSDSPTQITRKVNFFKMIDNFKFREYQMVVNRRLDVFEVDKNNTIIENMRLNTDEASTFLFNDEKMGVDKINNRLNENADSFYKGHSTTSITSNDIVVKKIKDQLNENADRGMDSKLNASSVFHDKIINRIHNKTKDVDDLSMGQSKTSAPTNHTFFDSKINENSVVLEYSQGLHELNIKGVLGDPKQYLSIKKPSNHKNDKIIYCIENSSDLRNDSNSLDDHKTSGIECSDIIINNQEFKKLTTDLGENFKEFSQNPIKVNPHIKAKKHDNPKMSDYTLGNNSISSHGNGKGSEKQSKLNKSCEKNPTDFTKSNHNGSKIFASQQEEGTITSLRSNSENFYSFDIFNQAHRFAEPEADAIVDCKQSPTDHYISFHSRSCSVDTNFRDLEPYRDNQDIKSPKTCKKTYTADSTIKNRIDNLIFNSDVIKDSPCHDDRAYAHNEQTKSGVLIENNYETANDENFPSNIDNTKIRKSQKGDLPTIISLQSLQNNLNQLSDSPEVDSDYTNILGAFEKGKGADDVDTFRGHRSIVDENMTPYRGENCSLSVSSQNTIVDQNNSEREGVVSGELSNAEAEESLNIYNDVSNDCEDQNPEYLKSLNGYIHSEVTYRDFQIPASKAGHEVYFGKYRLKKPKQTSEKIPATFEKLPLYDQENCYKPIDDQIRKHIDLTTPRTDSVKKQSTLVEANFRPPLNKLKPKYLHSEQSKFQNHDDSTFDNGFSFHRKDSKTEALDQKKDHFLYKASEVRSGDENLPPLKGSEKHILKNWFDHSYGRSNQIHAFLNTRSHTLKDLNLSDPILRTSRKRDFFDSKAYQYSPKNSEELNVCMRNVVFDSKSSNEETDPYLPRFTDTKDIPKSDPKFGPELKQIDPHRHANSDIGGTIDTSCKHGLSDPRSTHQNRLKNSCHSKKIQEDENLGHNPYCSFSRDRICISDRMDSDHPLSEPDIRQKNVLRFHRNYDSDFEDNRSRSTSVDSRLFRHTHYRHRAHPKTSEEGNTKGYYSRIGNQPSQYSFSLDKNEIDTRNHLHSDPYDKHRKLRQKTLIRLHQRQNSIESDFEIRNSEYEKIHEIDFHKNYRKHLRDSRDYEGTSDLDSNDIDVIDYFIKNNKKYSLGMINSGLSNYFENNIDDLNEETFDATNHDFYSLLEKKQSNLGKYGKQKNAMESAKDIYNCYKMYDGQDLLKSHRQKPIRRSRSGSFDSFDLSKIHSRYRDADSAYSEDTVSKFSPRIQTNIQNQPSNKFLKSVRDPEDEYHLSKELTTSFGFDSENYNRNHEIDEYNQKCYSKDAALYTNHSRSDLKHSQKFKRNISPREFHQNDGCVSDHIPPRSDLKTGFINDFKRHATETDQPMNSNDPTWCSTELQYLFNVVNDEAERLRLCYDQADRASIAHRIVEMVEKTRELNRQHASIKTPRTRPQTSAASQEQLPKRRRVRQPSETKATEARENVLRCPSEETQRRTRGRPPTISHETGQSSEYDDVGMKVDIKRGFVDFDDALFSVVQVRGEKEYACPEPACKKSFPSLSRVKRHYIVHTGYKPFKCLNKKCTKSFSRKDNMLQHYRAHCEQNKSKSN